MLWPSFRVCLRPGPRPGPAASPGPAPGLVTASSSSTGSRLTAAATVAGSAAVTAATRARTRAGSGPGTGSSSLFLDELDLPPVEVGAIQFVNGPLHVGLASELHDALATPDVVGVGVHDLARLAHVVLQILPRGPGAQIFHDQLIASSLAGRVALPPHGRPAAAAASASSPGVPGVLHLDPTAEEPGAVQILDRVLGISHVIKLTETIGSLLIPLDDHVPNPSISLKQLLDIPVAGIIGDVPQIDLVLAHLFEVIA